MRESVDTVCSAFHYIGNFYSYDMTIKKWNHNSWVIHLITEFGVLMTTYILAIPQCCLESEKILHREWCNHWEVMSQSDTHTCRDSVVNKPMLLPASWYKSNFLHISTYDLLLSFPFLWFKINIKTINTTTKSILVDGRLISA